MTYRDRIERIIQNISTTIVDFSEDLLRKTPPTQVSSEFLTNKEQGDWAEKTLLDCINNNSRDYIAVKYGRDDDIVAGEENFREFFDEYQDELEDIGKRPDILIFSRSDFNLETTNISRLDRQILDRLVPKALCGIEVRSSAFLIDRYEEFMDNKQSRLTETILSLKNEILSDYGELLRSKDNVLYSLIESLTEENIHIVSFRVPSWRSSEELLNLSNKLKELKSNLKEKEKRDFLSITPKVEDLKLVYKWIETYNVPHYYVQVFFDKAYGISFEKILTLISQPNLEGREYTIESDPGNQNKSTIKIRANREENILERIHLPEHYSEMKELGRGRLLFFVKFRNSLATLNIDAFENLFGFRL